MQYTKLNVDQQQSMLEQRLAQYEAEHYAHSLNKELLLANGSTDKDAEKALEDADSAMAILDEVHAQITEKLAALSDPATSVQSAQPAQPTPTPPQ